MIHEVTMTVCKVCICELELLTDMYNSRKISKLTVTLTFNSRMIL